MENIHQIDHEQSIDTDKLSYEIFSILESKFLFGYDDQRQKVWINPKQLSSTTTSPSATTPPRMEAPPRKFREDDMNGLQAIKNQRGKICILSIDGGGMRSIISGKALSYLENALKVKSGNHEARIADYFDVATGSGVGGIFTAMLFASKDHNRPIFDADDTWKLLAEKGKKFYRFGKKSGGNGGGFLRRVMKGARCGNTASLEKVMKESFVDDKTGKNLTLKDTLKPLLIPCYDLTSTAPFVFSRADAMEADSYDYRLWEVCRATSAEPAMFEPVLMKSVDGATNCMAVGGALAMSNPTAAAITHVLHNKQEFPFVRGVEDILVLSLGTGQLAEGSFEYQQVRKWKSKEWARPMARIYSDGSADLVDHAIAMAFGQARSNNYVRIQANGSSFAQCGIAVDFDPSSKNVKTLIGVADDMLKQRYVESVLFTGKKIGEQSNFEKLDWFAGQLVEEHQRRSCRIAPTVAFKQPTPRTPNLNDRSL